MIGQLIVGERRLLEIIKMIGELIIGEKMVTGIDGKLMKGKKEGKSSREINSG